MRNIYIRFCLTEEERGPFGRLVAEVTADAQGLKGKNRAKKISEIIQELNRERSIARMASR
jgi:hypothetical protein